MMLAALAAAFGLPLAAQAQTTVQVYGKLYPQINSNHVSSPTAAGTPQATFGNTAGTAPPDTEMLASNSRLGFRGTEDLGGGLKALFQLEMTVGLDSGAGGSGTTLFNRDTFVGMSGGFGTVRLGNIDTVYKSIGDTLSFLGVSSGNFVSTSNILSKQGFGSNSASSFHLRRANSVIWESPEFNNFQVLLDYSLADTNKTPTRNPWVTSVGAKYEAGPIYLALAHEIHKDLFGGSRNVATALSNFNDNNARSKDKATRFTARYEFAGTTRVEVNLVRSEFNETGGAVGRFQSYKHNAYSIGAEHRMGVTTLAASYGAATAGSCSRFGGAACDTSGLDGKMFNLGAAYALSKRTSLFALYSRMDNGKSAAYNNLATGNPASGADIDQFALGISHSF
jgi:predicted porin